MSLQKAEQSVTAVVAQLHSKNSSLAPALPSSSASASSLSSGSSSLPSPAFSTLSFSASPSTDTTALLTSLRRRWQSPSFDSTSVQHLLDHDNHDMRAALKEFMRSPLFVPRYDVSIAEERRLAYERLKAVCGQGLFSVKDFGSNPHRIYAAHEVLGWADGGHHCSSTRTRGGLIVGQGRCESGTC